MRWAGEEEDRGFAPDRSRRIFPAGKIHNMPSFGTESKIICPMLVTRTTKGQKIQNGQKRSTMVQKKKSIWVTGEACQGSDGKT
jgi:hypothetical protein